MDVGHTHAHVSARSLVDTETFKRPPIVCTCAVTLLRLRTETASPVYINFLNCINIRLSLTDESRLLREVLTLSLKTSAMACSLCARNRSLFEKRYRTRIAAFLIKFEILALGEILIMF